MGWRLEEAPMVREHSSRNLKEVRQGVIGNLWKELHRARRQKHKGLGQEFAWCVQKEGLANDLRPSELQENFGLFHEPLRVLSWGGTLGIHRIPSGHEWRQEARRGRDSRGDRGRTQAKGSYSVSILKTE